MTPGGMAPAAKKPICAAAYFLVALAVVYLLSGVRELIDLLRQSFSANGEFILFSLVAEDAELLILPFTFLCGAAVMAELLDRIRWTLAGGGGPLRRTYLATWLADALRRVRTFAQADIAAEP